MAAVGEGNPAHMRYDLSRHGLWRSLVSALHWG